VSVGFCLSILCNIDESLLPLLKTLVESNNLSDSVQLEKLPDCQRKTADVVILDVLDRNGVLRDDILLKTASMLRSPLFDQSVVVPSSVTVCAACISCPALRANSQVLGSVPTLGLDIAQFINKYQVKTQVDLDLRRLPHTIITEPLPFFAIKIGSYETIRAKKRASVNMSGHITAVAFWFGVHLTKDHLITTFSAHKESHWKQAAILLPSDLEVTEGQLIDISFLLRDSCIHFDVEYVDMAKLHTIKVT
jgi:type II protein arginine methyltransferase